MSEKKVLVFLHIPKTAGTSFGEILDKHFKPEYTVNIYPRKGLSHEQFEALPKERFKRTQCIKGHIAFGANKFLDRSVTYVTFVREPISRAISGYTFFKKKRAHPKRKTMSKFISLEDFISRQRDNVQTRFISGVIGKGNSGFAKDSILETAIENIDNYFPVVGVVNYFDESLVIMKHLLGLKNIFYIKQNISNKYKTCELSPEIIKMIKKNNELDFQLYEYACKLLKQKMSSLGINFMQELCKFQKRSAIYSHLFKPYYNTVYNYHRLRDYVLYSREKKSICLRENKQDRQSF